jgi:hypothetical protein
MHRFPGPNLLTEGHLFLPFLAVSRALLPQGLSYNVGHFGPTFARSKGPYLGSGLGVELKISCAGTWAREVQMSKGGWSCEAG